MYQHIHFPFFPKMSLFQFSTIAGMLAVIILGSEIRTANGQGAIYLRTGAIARAVDSPTDITLGGPSNWWLTTPPDYPIRHQYTASVGRAFSSASSSTRFYLDASQNSGQVFGFAGASASTNGITEPVFGVLGSSGGDVQIDFLNSYKIDNASILTLSSGSLGGASVNTHRDQRYIGVTAGATAGGFDYNTQSQTGAAWFVANFSAVGFDPRGTNNNPYIKLPMDVLEDFIDMSDMANNPGSAPPVAAGSFVSLAPVEIGHGLNGSLIYFGSEGSSDGQFGDGETGATAFEFEAFGSNFSKFSIPNGILGNTGLLSLSFMGNVYQLNSGDLFDFTLFQSGGISKFTLSGISESAMLAPDDLEFKTAVEFTTPGQVYFTATAVPEPNGLLSSVLLALAVGGFRRRSFI